MVDMLAVILAAGKGVRMHSNPTKVLHKIAGKPMLEHVINRSLKLDSKIICVVGHQAEKVRKTLNYDSLRFVLQKEQLGTGHAVLQAKEYIKKHAGAVLVLCGDTPLLTVESLEKLRDYHFANQAGASVLTARVANPRGYGRIIRDRQDRIKNIVEEADASEQQKEIKEINSGVYCFDSSLLVEGLDSLDCDNQQNEYYLTDVVSYINKNGHRVLPVTVGDSAEIIGINDRVSLARAEKIMRQQINEKLMYNGVTIIDPQTTYIDEDVKIGKDTVIYPFTYIEGESEIGEETVVFPHTRIVNSRIGNCVELKLSCNIHDSIIKDNCIIGPFAYIRPGSRIEDGVEVGDFVELKKAIIDQGTKVNHLSYVGDAEIGKNTNIGAGTVFANYDGRKKHKTRVGDSVFIGSNTTLIAPVTVADRGRTGAGAVVTHDVASETTVIGVPARIYNKKK